jgi:hypothetical protein
LVRQHVLQVVVPDAEQAVESGEAAVDQEVGVGPLAGLDVQLAVDLLQNLLDRLQ